MIAREWIVARSKPHRKSKRNVMRGDRRLKRGMPFLVVSASWWLIGVPVPAVLLVPAARAGDPCLEVNELLRRGTDVSAIADATGLSATEIDACAQAARGSLVRSPRKRRPGAAGPAPLGAAGPPPLGAAGPAPHGAAGPAPHGAAGPAPHGAPGPPPHGAAGPPP